jgi:ankyrin repeat protein
MKKVLVTTLLSTILLLSRLAAGQAAPGSLDDQLHNAVYGGDTAKVQQLLQQGANIEAKDDKYGDTPLIDAAEKGLVDVVKLLLDKGANIEAKNNDGDTALLYVAGSRETDVVAQCLLQPVARPGTERAVRRSCKAAQLLPGVEAIGG